MKFLIDAQLPRLLAVRLRELGQDAGHTLDLPAGNLTSDREIAEHADHENAVVITKDADFITSHLLFGKPPKLLLVSTGNISNRNLLGLFETHIDSILSTLANSSFIELTGAGLIVRD